jgi:putative tricarboxylic transport membrane protein
MNKDLASGLVLLVLAGAYFWAAETIPNSMLDDAFGPRGLPVVLAGLLAVLAIILTLRGIAELRSTAATASSKNEEESPQPEAHLPRALGFLLIGLGYMLVLPLVGYAIAIALLIATVALYEGAARNWRVPATAIFGGVLFWLLFNKVLGVGEPSGMLFTSLFS